MSMSNFLVLTISSGAMLMAMYIRGLDADESTSLARCMFEHGNSIFYF